jgi:protein-S-isoprenylcysteine O-methyltransferase Ste14
MLTSYDQFMYNVASLIFIVIPISLVLEDINDDEKKKTLNELKTEINSGLVNIKSMVCCVFVVLFFLVFFFCSSCILCMLVSNTYCVVLCFCIVLFVLSVEIMASRLRSNKDIKGFQIKIDEKNS